MGKSIRRWRKDVIDGVIAPIDTFRTLHFDEVGESLRTLSVPRGAYPSRAIGEAAWRRLTPRSRAARASRSVWEAALRDEIEKSAKRRGARSAGRTQVTVDLAGEQDGSTQLYLADAQSNARALARLGIDGLDAFRKARASVKPTGPSNAEGRVNQPLSGSGWPTSAMSWPGRSRRTCCA
jgi:hypothetical protein